MKPKKTRTEIHDERESKLNILIESGFYKNKTDAVNAAIDMIFQHHLREENERSALEQAHLYDESLLSIQGLAK